MRRETTLGAGPHAGRVLAPGQSPAQSLDPSADPSLDMVLAAVAHPTRRAVVARLAVGTATVGELAEGHSMSLPAFSKHLRVLADAGLVDRHKVGRSVVCSLVAGPLDEMAVWVTDVTSYWTATLDRLEHVITEEDA